MRVIAQQGDTVDSLCWRHLGSSKPVEETLEANPGLSAIGPVLPIGTPVDLPDQVSAVQTTTLINLWD
ncbi:MAG TPA: tail protein X [Rhodocyclaceae bacterium]|nr:tail protein X [Rhodocyclaceae bacterium]